MNHEEKKIIEEIIKNAVGNSVSGLSADIRILTQVVERHEIAIDGNGKAGLVENVTILRAVTESMERSLTKVSKFADDMKVDRQKIFDSTESLKKDIKKEEERNEEEIEGLDKRITPLEGSFKTMVKITIGVSTLTFIFGAVVMFILSRFEAIAAMFGSIPK